MRVQIWIRKRRATGTLSDGDILRSLKRFPSVGDDCHIDVFLGCRAGAGSWRVLLRAATVETSPTTGRLDDSH